MCAVSTGTKVYCDKGCISKNATTLTGGGVIAQLGSGIYIISTLLYDNVSLYPGGGVSVLPFSEVKCEKSIISRNKSTLVDYVDFRGGGGIYVSGSASTGRVELVNSIIWGNSAYQGADILAEDMAECIAEYSVIGDIMGRLSISDHVLNVDPLFSAPLKEDFHIIYGSPCIDAGSPSYGDGGSDLDGESRVFNNRIDIGVDEFTDHDGDTMADYWERRYFGSESARSGSELGDDEDRLTVLDEYLTGANPFDRDTDNDLAADDVEVENSMNPALPDEDNDGMLDGWEFFHNLDWTQDDSQGNPDGDFMTNIEEFGADTRPNDGSSWLGLTKISRKWGGTQVDWQGGRDAVQWIESSTNLVDWKCEFGLAPPISETNSAILYDNAMLPSAG